MSSDLEGFRAELRAAGQPYSLWGGRIVGLGLLVLVAAQVLMIQRQAMTLAALGLIAGSLGVMAVGWVLLVIAFVRRRRWAKDNPLSLPDLSSVP